MDARRLLTTVAALLLCLADVKASGEFTIDVEPGAFTIEQALQQARLTVAQWHGGWGILRLKPGVYRLSQPIVIRPEDESLSIVATGDVVISGARPIKGWRRQGRLWVADVPEFN